MDKERIDRITGGLLSCICKDCEACPYANRYYCEDEVRRDAADALRELTEESRQPKKGGGER